MGNTIVDNGYDGVQIDLTGSPDAEAATILFTNNLITGNGFDGVDIYTYWSDTTVTFAGGNTINYNYDSPGDYDIRAYAGSNGDQVLHLISAANTLGTVTYNGWSTVIP